MKKIDKLKLADDEKAIDWGKVDADKGIVEITKKK